MLKFFTAFDPTAWSLGYVIRSIRPGALPTAGHCLSFDHTYVHSCYSTPLLPCMNNH